MCGVERLEIYGNQVGLLRCANVAAPSEIRTHAIIFWGNMVAFQEWILTRPEPEAQEPEQ